MLKHSNIQRLKWNIKKVIKTSVFQITILYNKYALFRNIKRIYRSSQGIVRIDRSNKRKYVERWSKLGSKPSMIWYKTYKRISGIDDPSYIPETCYYHKVELILNRKTLFDAYADKNNYNKIIDKALLADVYLRNMDGVYYTGDYEFINAPVNLSYHIPPDKDRFIIKKAIGSCGGKSIQLFSKKNDKWINNQGEELSAALLEKSYSKDFILLEVINQHPFYKRFNETSVNTVRIFTYRSVRNNAIIVLQALLRIGRSGSVVDNVSSGGICCGIDLKGVLGEFGLGKKGDKVFQLNNVVFKKVGILYGFDKILKTAKEIAGRFYYHRLIGFDFCIDENNNVKIIEVNLHDIGINHQLMTGPLFREYTDEIIDYCRENRRTVSINFEL